MDNLKCGGYIFNSNFDSGNLAKVELIKLHEDIIPSENIINAEFNAWTKPDCGGTEYENLNRSWFLFSIHGGEPNKVCKINVVNLNKQAKLFSQGMHPVIRIGETGKWERMKDSPSYFIDTDNFTLTFLHKPLENVNVKYFYAFTFPFTYTECQEQLDRFDKLYQKEPAEVNYIIKRLISPTSTDGNAESQVDNIETDEKVYYSLDQFNEIIASKFALRDMTKLNASDLESEIYYHRELLIHSVEGRNIDLLTISSFHGIQLEREQRLPNLFPNIHTVRCNTFKNKKIIFISSRVHPGETPASFVLNGFLKLIFDKRNVVAAALRKMYVFKVVPFLNPDGVFNGCYRSDTLGHNLNRMYLNPKIDTQPSIYAVRKLIRYYHYDKDVQEQVDNTQPPDKTLQSNNSDSNYTIVTINDLIDNQTNKPTDASQYFKENVQEVNSTESSRSQSSDSEVFDLCETKSNPLIVISGTDDVVASDTAKEISLTLQQQQQQTQRSIDDRTVGRVFHEKLMTEIKPIIITGPSQIYSKKPFSASKKHGEDALRLSTTGRFSDSTLDNLDLVKKRTQMNINLKQGGAGGKALLVPATPRKEFYSSCRSRTPTQVMGQYRITKRRNTCNTPTSNLNISADFTQQNQLQEQTVVDASNMFLYIDLHGHASKKGIFMYGNHLPNAAEAVECMLLPRLMSMNCHHFHFDACVFSERNMYHKGKRDGLSKEGSGRVAVYKTIGLIKSYTLEGNYNTGKYVNVLPPRGKESVCRKVNLCAPKYTPLIFEDVGRALGPSILDLTGSNPMSRIQNSEFKSIQGLRNSLRTEIDKSFSRTMYHAKALTAKAKRMKNPAPCCSSLLAPEISSKENKGKNALNKQITTTFGKKEGPSGRKKGKILCDVLASTVKYQEQQPVPPTKRPKVAKKVIIPLDGCPIATSDTDVAGPSMAKKSQELLQVEISTDIQIGTDISGSESTGGYFTPTTSTSDPMFAAAVSSGAADVKNKIHIDAERPCCSHSIRSTVASMTNFSMKKKKIGAFTTSLSSSSAMTAATASPSGTQSSCTASASTQSLLSSVHGKKQSSSSSTSSLLKIRSKYSSSTSGVATGSSASGLLKPLKRSNSSKDGLRLKKKKILKSDSNMKRKKSRVF